jgi:hypothetical protein
MIVGGSIDVWDSTPFLVFVAIVIIGVSTFTIVSTGYWRLFVQWVQGLRGREWPMVSAVIDTVSVIQQRQGTGHGDMVYYLVTLTYSYRSPELQVGDYNRLFSYDEEEDAKAWAASYKSSTVRVHVDPRDPSRSVLRKEDL